MKEVGTQVVKALRDAGLKVKRGQQMSQSRFCGEEANQIVTPSPVSQPGRVRALFIVERLLADELLKSVQ